MKEQIERANDPVTDAKSAEKPTTPPEPRPWVKPTFERVDMKEALGPTTSTVNTEDGVPGTSS